MSVTTETTVIKLQDGSEMALFVARPESANAPGILVFQEVFGINAFMKEFCARLADEGFIAVAPEFFHRTAPRGYVGAYEDFPAAAPHIQGLTLEGIQADILGAYDWLRNDSQIDSSKIASIGFCFGGRASYIANATVDLKAAISFYGGGIAPNLLGLAKAQRAPILFLWGGLDKHFGPEYRKEVMDAMTSAGKQFVNIEFSSADHGFFSHQRKEYNDEAARQAWPLVLAFLKSYL